MVEEKKNNEELDTDNSSTEEFDEKDPLTMRNK